MALTKLVNGERVQCSATEEKAIRAEWKNNEKEAVAKAAETEREEKIRVEIDRITREQAIANLESRGEL